MHLFLREWKEYLGEAKRKDWDSAHVALIRGKKVLNSMDSFLIHRFKKEHKRSLVTVVARDNISSIKARERMGFKRVGHITVIGLLGYQYGHIPKKDLTYLKT